MKSLQITVAGLLVFAFAFGNIYKFSFFSQDVHMGLIDLAVLIITLTAVTLRFRQVQTEISNFRDLLIPLAGFLAVAAISLLLAIGNFGIRAFAVGSLYWFRFVFYSLFFISLKCLLTPSRIKQVIYSIGAVTVGLGALQYLVLPDVRFLDVAEWDPHYFRVVGTLLDPGFIAIILVFFLVYLFLKPLSNRRLFRLWLILSYLVFALTYSRSGFLALFAASILFSRVKKNWKVAAKTAVLIILTLLILPRSPGGEGVKLERTSSIQARIANWRDSLIIFTDHPVIGVGFNTYRYAQKQAGFLQESIWLKSHAGAGADASILFIAATTGLIGLAFYLNFARALWKLAAGQLYLKITLFALFFHSLFLNSLFYPYVLIWISLLLALSQSPRSRDYT